MKKKHEKKLVLQADRIRELTLARLPEVVGGRASGDGAGGSGSTETTKPPGG